MSQWRWEQDRAQRLADQDRPRALARGGGDEIEIFCAHDVVEYERLAHRPARVPASAILRPVPAAAVVRPPRVPVTVRPAGA